VGPYLHLADTGVFDLTKVEDEHFWQSTLEALSVVEQVTTKMLECVTGTGGEMQGSNGLKNLAFDDEEDDSISQNYDSKSAASSLDVTIGANNIRVKSRRNQKDQDLLRARDDDSAVIDRENSLAHSSVDGGEESEGRASNPKVSQQQQQQQTALSAAVEDVPSNKSVKRSSERTTVEAARKLENEKKLKRFVVCIIFLTVSDIFLSRLQERMALGRSAAAVDDGGIGGLAAYKAQKAAADRLCTTQSLPTLPPGVKIRDDVMTKTKAFLTVMPDLG
jgi:E3 ubiquitin-protein ligase DOA10